ncbi:UNVERIFIED_ORG: hypothetical protein LHK14_15520 [Roseateles sp. XES5]|nr:hypothetical protein [Roseateles sp. XES5]
MKKTVTIALASLLAVSPVAGIAYAQDTTTGMTADTMATGSITADQVNVVTIASLEADESGRSEGERLSLKAKDPAALEQTQAELQSDPALAQILASKNVQLNNVVEIKTAADGGKVVYVK